MSATKHTPGPWDLVFLPGAWAAVDSGSGLLTSPDHPNERLSYEERLANARLMAAAPDLADLLFEALGPRPGKVFHSRTCGRSRDSQNACRSAEPCWQWRARFALTVAGKLIR